MSPVGTTISHANIDFSIHPRSSWDCEFGLLRVAVAAAAAAAADIHDDCFYSHCTRYIAAGAVAAAVTAVAEFGRNTDFVAAADNAADVVQRDNLVWLLWLWLWLLRPMMVMMMMELRSTDCTVMSVFHSRCESNCSGRAISLRNSLRRTSCLS